MLGNNELAALSKLKCALPELLIMQRENIIHECPAFLDISCRQSVVVQHCKPLIPRGVGGLAPREFSIGKIFPAKFLHPLNSISR
jgi:hypothetical protein